MRADGSSKAASICCHSSLSGISPFDREVVERVGIGRGSCSAVETGAAFTDATGAGVGQGLGIGVGLDASAGIDLCVGLNVSLTNGL